MELFEEARKLGVPDVDITEAEWRDEYSNLYSVMALDGSFLDKIIAAEDIIKMYLVIQARKAESVSPDACPYCLGKGKEPANSVMVRCRFCGGSGVKT